MMFLGNYWLTSLILSHFRMMYARAHTHMCINEVYCLLWNRYVCVGDSLMCLVENHGPVKGAEAENRDETHFWQPKKLHQGSVYPPG
jgi:hypothetical protein